MKIAIVGTAPSSKWKAPFNNSEWEIWACSPGNVDLPKVDAWFEIHNLERVKQTFPEFFNLLKNFSGKVYLQKEDKEIPNSVEFPFEQAIKDFSPYFFTSSGAYMMALAILQGAKTIGIFGFDMQAADEYEYQRPGMHFFIREAKRLGIEVVTTPESDILRPSPPYGFCERDPMWIKLQSRKEELKQKLETALYQKELNDKTAVALKAAVKNMDYIIRTWI